jgi:hypothetical protein
MLTQSSASTLLDTCHAAVVAAINANHVAALLVALPALLLALGAPQAYARVREPLAVLQRLMRAVNTPVRPLGGGAAPRSSSRRPSLPVPGPRAAAGCSVVQMGWGAAPPSARNPSPAPPRRQPARPPAHRPAARRCAAPAPASPPTTGAS